MFQGSCNKELFIQWVQTCLIPELKQGQTIIMDNASFHKDDCIKDMLERAGCKLIYLPPYSPELNPIAKFWANMKAWIQKNIKDISDTTNAIQQFFQNYTKTQTSK